MDNYKVYVHINKVNGKRYYGITSQKVEKRWNNGRGYKFWIDKKGRRHGNKHFWRSICKYGWNEGFEHIVIARGLTKAEAEWLEIELIREWDTTNEDKGYNITKGGESNKPTEKTRKKMSEAKKGKNKGKNNPGAIKVYCVELDMYFDTIKEASEYVGCNDRTISQVLRGERKTSGGYHWIYANEVNEENINRVISQEKIILKGKNHPNAKAIYCIELDMYFDTIKEASEYIGCAKENISGVLRGKSKTCGGYHFIYANEVNEENINRVLSEESNILKGKNNPNATKVYCVELEQYFDTIVEASEYVGCHMSNISGVLRGKSKKACGYHWLYAEDVNEKNINRILSKEYNTRANKGKNSPNAKAIYCIELDMYFDTIVEASEYVGCFRQGISKVLNGKYKTCGGYHWLYAEDVEKIEIENNKVS